MDITIIGHSEQIINTIRSQVEAAIEEGTPSIITHLSQAHHDAGVKVSLGIAIPIEITQNKIKVGAELTVHRRVNEKTDVDAVVLDMEQGELGLDDGGEK